MDSSIPFGLMLDLSSIECGRTVYIDFEIHGPGNLGIRDSKLKCSHTLQCACLLFEIFPRWDLSIILSTSPTAIQI